MSHLRGSVPAGHLPPISARPCSISIETGAGTILAAAVERGGFN
jgi:hypothetical protein